MQLPGLTVGVVADDLTGACDTALQFFRAGCKTRVLLEPGELPVSDDENNQVWAINTESRHIEARNAIAKVRESVDLLREHYGAEHFYKKMDSTLRGHFTDECLAAVDELGWDCVLVAPAYPEEGRRTVGGYQLVHGIPVEQTEVARDPLFPVRQSHIPTLMAEASKPDIVGYIELSTVLRGAGPLLAELTDLIEDGKKLVVVDACSNTDLEQIALAIEKIQKTAKVLPCGSAGLAQALNNHWPSREEEEPEPIAVPQSPILVGVGTNTALTRSQILQLMDNYPYYGEGSDLSVFDIDAEKILGLSPLEAMIDQVVEALGDNNTVVLSTSLKEENLPRTLEIAEENGIAEEDVARKAQDTLSRVTQEVLERASAKLILTGGETATHICHVVGCANFRIVAEIEPSIPLMEEISKSDGEGTAYHKWIVTKSGNFGSELALANIVRYLKQHEVSPAEIS